MAVQGRVPSGHLTEPFLYVCFQTGDGTLSYADLTKDLSKPYEEEKQDEEEESHGFEYQAHLARTGIKRIKKEKDILKLTIEKSKVHLEELEEKLAIMKKDQSRMFQVRVAP